MAELRRAAAAAEVARNAAVADLMAERDARIAAAAAAAEVAEGRVRALLADAGESAARSGGKAAAAEKAARLAWDREAVLAGEEALRVRAAAEQEAQSRMEALQQQHVAEQQVVKHLGPLDLLPPPPPVFS